MSNVAAGMDVQVNLVDNVSQGLKTVQSGIIRLVGAITAATAAAAAVGYPIREAVQYERALANIAKTTGFTESQINRVGRALLDLSTTTSRSAVELAEIATVAGQLGLGVTAGVQGIIEFTQVVGEAATALNILEEEAAKMGATILNIFKYEAGDARNILSVINELSNTSVARGEEIADIVSRIGSIAGLAFPQVAALAAYSKDLGVSTEVAGTSFVKIFTRMLSSAENFSALMQVSTEEWIAMVEEDAVGALQSAAAAVAELGAAAQASTINKLFGQGRVYALTAKIVEDASNSFQLLDRHVATANTQMEEGTSIGREFAAVMGTTEEQVKQTGNVITALATTAGQATLPVIKELLADLREWASDPVTQEVFLDLGEQLAGFVRWLGDAVKWVAALGINWGGLAKIILYVVGFLLAKWGVSVAASLVKHASSLQGISKQWENLRQAALRYANTVSGIVGSAASAGAAGTAFAGRTSATAAYVNTARDAEQALSATERAAFLDRKRLDYAKKLTEERRRAHTRAIIAKETAEKTLRTMEKSGTASQAQLAAARNRVVVLKEIQNQHKAAYQSQAAYLKQQSNLNNQQRQQAVAVAGFKREMLATNLATKQATSLGARLTATMVAAGAAAKGFVTAFLLPTIAIGIAFASLTFVVGKVAAAINRMSNERKREAREAAAAERARQAALGESLDLANEYYETLASPPVVKYEAPPFMDTENNVASLRSLAVEALRANEAINGFNENIKEQNSAISEQESELARLIARNEELKKQFDLDGTASRVGMTSQGQMMSAPSSLARQEYEENTKRIERLKLQLEAASAVSQTLTDRLSQVESRAAVVARNLVEIFARPVESDPSVITEGVRQYERLSEELSRLYDELDAARAAPDIEIDFTNIERLYNEIAEVERQMAESRDRIIRPRDAAPTGIPPEVSYAMGVVESLKTANSNLKDVIAEREALLSADAPDNVPTERLRLWADDKAEFDRMSAQIKDIESKIDGLLVKAGQIAEAGGITGQLMREAIAGSDGDVDAVAEVFELLRENMRRQEELFASLTEVERTDVAILRDTIRVREEELSLLAKIGAAEITLKQLQSDRAQGFGGDLIDGEVQAIEEYIAKSRQALSEFEKWRDAVYESGRGVDFQEAFSEIETATQNTLPALRERAGLATVEVENQKRLGVELVAQYAALQLQLQTVQSVSSELKYMADSARGFADNIGSWSVNFRNGIQQAARELEAGIVSRRLDVELDFKVEGIDDVISDLKKELDEVQKKAGTVANSVSQEFASRRENAVRFGTIFDVQRIDREIEAEIKRRIEVEQGNKAEAEREALLKKRSDAVEEIRDAQERVNELVSSSDPSDQAEATFLRQEIEGRIEGLARLNEELKSAKREVEDGPDQFLFSDDEMRRFKDEYLAIGTEFTAATIRNSEIQAEALRKSYEPYKTEIESIQKLLVDIPEQISRLGLPPEILENWRDWVELFKGADGVLSELVDPITMLRDGVEGMGGGFDLSRIFEMNPETFLTMLKTALDRAVDGVNAGDGGRLIQLEIDKKKAEKEAQDWVSILQRYIKGTKGENELPVDPIVNNTIQEQIDAKNYTADVDVRLRGAQNNARGGFINTDMATTGGYARGGKISGPGTATSDSILSWLSNGEYVIDAWTTRFFGSGFFKTLQQMARGGFGKSTVGKLGFPAFAGGGPVTTGLQSGDMLAQFAGATTGGSRVVQPSETVNLNFNIGRETFSLQGPRDQVKGLVESIKSANRGTMK